KTGVSTAPCAVTRRPRRAAPFRANTSNPITHPLYPGSRRKAEKNFRPAAGSHPAEGSQAATRRTERPRLARRDGEIRLQTPAVRDRDQVAHYQELEARGGNPGATS